MSADWLDDERTLEALDSAPLMFLAVVGRHGPHVTPLAFDRDGTDLWAVTPRNSAKARAIDRDSRVGILVRHRGRTVIAGGSAILVDPLTGRGLGALLRPDLPLTALGYFTRNNRRVVRAVTDQPSPSIPLTRTALRISLNRAALLDHQRVRDAWGNWPAAGALLTGSVAPAAPDLTTIPDRPRALVSTENRAAVLGWHSTTGPIALPAAWRPDGTITVPADALALAGALSAAAACLTVEHSGTRIRSVHGVILTGAGRARTDGTVATVRLETERVTWWSGEESGSRGAAVSRTA